MVWLTDAQTPPEMRLYAIGDVHGCYDLLNTVHNWVSRDLRERPVRAWKLIHVGDYVDRGARSREVVEYLLQLCANEPDVICLKGNHDAMFVESLTGDASRSQVWLANGGVETLASYGIAVAEFRERLRTGQGFEDAVPPAHLDFLDGLDLMARFGDFAFVHAGVEPDRPLDAQPEDALLWIRERFLRDGREFEAAIVHGHTPLQRPEVRANRIGIDTGAVFGGELTCLVLEGRRKGRLGPEGPMALL